MENPKVFISYSHSSDSYKDQIRDFATMLRSHGIDATFDEWELSGGNDLNAFMEQSIKDADKVIIACDKNYSDKANNRSGGAGIETYIISPEVYLKHNQNKYIPVIFEKDIYGNVYTPDYLKGRLYYDFTDPNNTLSKELLIRDIFGKPKYTKPVMGTIPTYIEEYEDDNPKAYLNSIFALSRVALGKINSAFSNSMISNLSVEIGKVYKENLISYKEYRDDPSNVTYNKIEKFEDLVEPYINILEAEVLSGNMKVNDLVTMFENLIKYDHLLKEGESTSTDGMWDHIDFSIYEIFLYTVTVLRTHNQHKAIKDLLHSNFFGLNRRYGQKYSDFVGFNKYLPSLEIRKSTLKLNRISLHADLIVDRAEKTKFKASSIVQTDLYLAFYSEIKNSYSTMGFWFPRLYIYESFFRTGDLFERLISKRYFNQFLSEIGLENKQELQKILETYKTDVEKEGLRNRGYSQSFSSVPLLTNVLDIDTLGTIE